MTATASASDRVPIDINGRVYVLRMPTVYDSAVVRRNIAAARARRVEAREVELIALVGLRQLGEATGDAEEAARQIALVEEWYELLKPLDENDFDEVDPEERAQAMLARGQERLLRIREMSSEILMIQSTLERHFAPYAELIADQAFYDEVQAIETVRLLLVQAGGAAVFKDSDGRMSEAVFAAIPIEDRAPLSRRALSLFAPPETTRKN